MTIATRDLDVRSEPAPCAVVVDVRELRYAAPPSPELDLPPVVRAGSAIRRWHGQWAIVQDDVRALALADDLGRAIACPMPAAADGRRAFDDLRDNKSAKPDFESAVVLPDGRLVVFGSGAKPLRELVVVGTAPDRLDVRAVPAFYAALRRAFGDVTLNVEAAVVAGDALLLFQRGTALIADGDDMPPALNAIASLPLAAFARWLDADGPVPEAVAVTRCRLGAHAGAALGFTAAAALPDGRIAFLACAEATADATRDGENLATRFGWIDGERARQGLVVDRHGRESRLKLEGLDPVPGVPGSFVAVTDADDPEASALLVRLEVVAGT